MKRTSTMRRDGYAGFDGSVWQHKNVDYAAGRFPRCMGWRDCASGIGAPRFDSGDDQATDAVQYFRSCPGRGGCGAG